MKTGVFILPTCKEPKIQLSNLAQRVLPKKQYQQTPRKGFCLDMGLIQPGLCFQLLPSAARSRGKGISPQSDEIFGGGCSLIILVNPKVTFQSAHKGDIQLAFKEGASESLAVQRRFIGTSRRKPYGFEASTPSVSWGAKSPLGLGVPRYISVFCPVPCFGISSLAAGHTPRLHAIPRWDPQNKGRTHGSFGSNSRANHEGIARQCRNGCGRKRAAKSGRRKHRSTNVGQKVTNVGRSTSTLASKVVTHENQLLASILQVSFWLNNRRLTTSNRLISPNSR